MEYNKFLEQKQILEDEIGFEYDSLPIKLFDFQKAITKWAIKRGRAAIFADTGLGKTFMQVSWADAVSKKTNKQVLIVAPLCVAEQTVEEAKKLNIEVEYARCYNPVSKILITNYEMLDYFKDTIIEGKFSGIVLDESSILKHQDSKTRQKVIDISHDIPYRLSCTATPSPNDYMELGSQAEFLGIMDSIEMLSLFFTHDASETQKWRLKGHARDRFWQWLSTWAVYIKKPSDLGFSNDGYDLPKLNIQTVNIGSFIDSSLSGLQERNKAKNDTIHERVEEAVKIINNSTEQFIVWCHRNEEAKLLHKLIYDSVNVSGEDSIEDKKTKIMDFTHSKVRVIITKQKIAGFGMNWQHCHNMLFIGLTDSYEQVYQAIRRCWRFGQKNQVNVYSIVHQREIKALQNINRKEKQAEEMATQLANHMSEFQKKEIFQLKRERMEYKRDVKEGNNWKMYLGDCVEVMKELPNESIGYSIFSPPFASLYVYSNSDRDMGNNRTYEEFWEHFNFMIPELYRILQSGRIVSVHCMNLPTSKQRDGYIGIKDFRGDIIRAFEKNGFIYQSEAVIWKDPVVAMQRTKALGLLWKQIKKDSSMCRQGIPDYLLTFRKPGENKKPIKHTELEFPVTKWQHYASPCWMDINQSNTLNGKFARQEDDERHICPLQLDVIFRAMDLWSLKGDVVFSPFAGIGSELFVAIQNERIGLGCELKESYFKIACDNLSMAKSMPKLDFSCNNGKNIKPKLSKSNYGNVKLDSFCEAEE
jgi:DNA modification methylase